MQRVSRGASRGGGAQGAWRPRRKASAQVPNCSLAAPGQRGWGRDPGAPAPPAARGSAPNARLIVMHCVSCCEPSPAEWGWHKLFPCHAAVAP